MKPYFNLNFHFKTQQNSAGVIGGIMPFQTIGNMHPRISEIQRRVVADFINEPRSDPPHKIISSSVSRKWLVINDEPAAHVQCSIQFPGPVSFIADHINGPDADRGTGFILLLVGHIPVRMGDGEAEIGRPVIRFRNILKYVQRFGINAALFEVRSQVVPIQFKTGIILSGIRFGRITG